MARLPTPSELAFMEAHKDDTLVPDMIACASICGVISLISIVLRLISRRIAGTPLHWNDWFIILAWINYIVFDICFATLVQWGGGRHIILVTNPRMLQIINIVNENIYCSCMMLIKWSILSLYDSIFPVRRFRWCLIGVAVFMMMWMIMCCFAAIFQCTPIPFGWDPTTPGGKCIHYGTVVLVAGIFNVLTDLVILALPIPLVLKLNLSHQRKWLIILTFMMGGSACIVSIIRLAFSLAVGSTADSSWDDMPAGMLSVVELMAGILAACLPVYRPLYRHLKDKSISISSCDSVKVFPMETSYVGENTSRSVKITGSRPSRDTPGGITVTDEVDIDMYTYKRVGSNWVRIYDGDFTRSNTLYKEEEEAGSSTDTRAASPNAL